MGKNRGTPERPPNPTRRPWGRVWERYPGSWYARWTHRGRRHACAAGASQAEARAFLDALREQLQSRGGLGPIPSVEEAVAAFLPTYKARVSPKTAAVAESRWKAVTAYFGDRLVDEIREAEAEDFLASLAVGAQTKRRYAAELSALWQWLRARKHVEGNPWREVKKPRVTEYAQPFLSMADLRKVLAAAPAPHKDAVAVIADTGLRRSELARLEAQDLGEKLRVRGKGGFVRHIPVTAAARTVLEQRAKTPVPLRGPHLLFPEYATVTAMNALSKDFSAATRAAGFRSVTLHTLRHTYAVHHVRYARTPLGELQRLMGHKTAAMTLRYARWAPEDAEAVAVSELERVRASVSRT